MIKLSDFESGGGGAFTTRWISGGIQIASGLSGVLFTITPPSGQKVRITGLTTDAQYSSQSGISLTIGGATVTSNLSLAPYGAAMDGTFGVAGGSTAISAGFLSEITGGTDEVITLVKDSGAAVQGMFYSYEFGE